MKRLISIFTLLCLWLGRCVGLAGDVNLVERLNAGLEKVPDNVAECAYKILNEDDNLVEICQAALVEFQSCFGKRENADPFNIMVPIKTWEKSKKFVQLENKECQRQGAMQSEALRVDQPKSDCQETSEVLTARSLDLEGRPWVREMSDPGSGPRRDYVVTIPARKVGPTSEVYNSLISQITHGHVLISKYFMLDGEMGFGVLQNRKTCQLSVFATDLRKHIQISKEPFELSRTRLTFSFNLKDSNVKRTLEIDNRH